jgi:cell division septal protein FtsQ
MSATLHPAAPPSPAAVHYQRGRRTEVKRRRKRFALRLKHVVLLVLAQAALFTGLQRLCLGLLEWDHLRLSRVDIHPRTGPESDRVEREAARYLSANLLVLDTAPLAARIRSLPWVKDARIRKSLPSSLRVDFTVRLPMAVLDRGTLFLVDEEGVLLGPAGPAAAGGLPVLRDDGRFAEDYTAKIGLARACLESLSASHRARVETLDLTDAACLSLTFRGDPARLLLGSEGFGEKAALYLRRARAWAADHGSLSTVDLRLPDRAYLRPGDGTRGAAAPSAREEVM